MIIVYKKEGGEKMYKTLKVRIDADKDIKGFLLQYEMVYHRALQHYVNVMIKRKKEVKYFMHSVMHSIAKHSRYLLYREACRRYAYYQKHQTWQFVKSSVWSAQDFIIEERKIILFFPDIFAYQTMVLPIACEKEEWQNIEGKRIVKMDLLHDESYWFCNIVYEVTCSEA